MSAILLGTDAGDWYESGPVREMTIRDNVFLECVEPVIDIDPHNSVPNDSVHQNITVTGNHFILRDAIAVGAKSTKGLTVAENAIYSDQQLTDHRIIRTTDCAVVHVEKNHYLPISEWADGPDSDDGN
jgi:hypothetical protein